MTRSSAPAGQAALATARAEGTRARLVLLVLCGASFMVALDISILNVALPRLGASLGIGQASLQWGITAFELPSGGFLLAAALASARIAALRHAGSGFGAATLGGIRLGLTADAAVVVVVAAALLLAVLLRRRGAPT